MRTFKVGKKVCASSESTGVPFLTVGNHISKPNALSQATFGLLLWLLFCAIPLLCAAQEFFEPSLPSEEMSEILQLPLPIDDAGEVLFERVQSGDDTIADGSVEDVLDRMTDVDTNLTTYPTIYLNSRALDTNFVDDGFCCSSCICGGDPTGPICIPPSCSTGILGFPFRSSDEVATAAAEVSISSTNKPETIASISEMNRFSPFSYFTTVALQRSDGQVFCSGVLVDEDSVLTAAHCLCEELPAYVFIGNSVFEEDRLTAANNVSTSIPVETEATFYEEGFCREYATWQPEVGQFPSGDIALLQLQQALPATLSEFGLPTEAIANGEADAFVYGVGYGRADGVNLAGEKHRARFQFLSRLCTAEDSAQYDCILGEESVITGFEDSAGQDSCFGDSGGPVFIRDSPDLPVPAEGFAIPPLLVGITSRGIAANAEGYCGRGAINVSLEPQQIRNWIDENR